MYLNKFGLVISMPLFSKEKLRKVLTQTKSILKESKRQTKLVLKQRPRRKKNFTRLIGLKGVKL